MSRILKRPPNGWDRKPNAQLLDWCLFVGLLWAGAMFFRWIEAAANALLSL